MLNFLHQNKGEIVVREKKIIDHNGNVIPFSPYQYKTLYDAKDSLSHLLEANAVFVCCHADSEMVSDEFIQKHANAVYQKREESVFLRQLDHDVFCEYVLPYRAGEEKFIDYHQELEKRFRGFVGCLNQDVLLKDKARAINTKLKEILEFDLRSHAQLYEPSVVEVLTVGVGSCNSLTAVTAQTMRYFGIPSAVDECPVWAHRNSGHRWNAFLTENGEWIPFSGAEANPSEFDVISDSTKSPKIYRHTFSSQKSFQPPNVNNENLPPVFKYPNRVDVTHEYVSVSNVEIEIKNSDLRQEQKIAYLAVFNAEQWSIAAWAEIENGKARFANMGNNHIVYLPCFYEKGKVVPAGSPFILKTDEMTFVEIRVDDMYPNINLYCYNKFFDYQWNIGYPSEGNKIELFFWDNEWVSCGICVVKDDKKLIFRNVPKGALYLLKSFDWENTWQRIFTIEDGEQIWF